MGKAILGMVLCLTALLAGCGGKSTEPTTGDVLDGEKLVQERCTRCHDLERIYSAEKDRDGWEKTVDRMIGNGAQLDDAERRAVIEYLSGL